MKKLIILLLIPLFIMGCETRPTLDTPSNITVLTKPNIAKEAIMTLFLEKNGFCDETKNTLTCEAPIDEFKSMFTQSLLVGPYGEAPVLKYKFTFIEKNEVTKIYGVKLFSIGRAYGSKIRDNNPLSIEEMGLIKSVIAKYEDPNASDISTRFEKTEPFFLRGHMFSMVAIQGNLQYHSDEYLLKLETYTFDKLNINRIIE